ncbi:hypothetical protein [Myxosarcina sp. GI1(2024)]
MNLFVGKYGKRINNKLKVQPKKVSAAALSEFNLLKTTIIPLTKQPEITLPIF